MGFNRLFRRLTVRGTAGAPPATPLRYSDYLAGAAIVTGIVGGSTFVSSLTGHGSDVGTTVVGVAGLLTTIFTTLSQWLQSKGD